MRGEAAGAQDREGECHEPPRSPDGAGGEADNGEKPNASKIEQRLEVIVMGMLNAEREGVDPFGESRKHMGK